MLFILFGGELFLTFAALRVALWVLRGWRDFDAGPSPGPSGPEGGLPLARPGSRPSRGARTRAPGRSQREHLRPPAFPCRKVAPLS
jgi:hypothetical protein